MNKTRFMDLTWPLKASVIMSWVVGGIFALVFIVEFVRALWLGY